MKQLEVASDYTGIGAFEQALKLLQIPYKTVFACDKDKFARQTYAANYLTDLDLAMEKIGTLGKLANGDWCGNFYFPQNVYNRKIPKKPLDVYVSTPPCQTFSFSGKRDGENDKRGILFYNTHEFIQINKPRYFIIENVKGLLSDNKGKTFTKWCDMLGGKSINGNPVIFPHNDSVPYHIYWQVLNAKHYGVPQNRERVFIVGIRDDVDNNFRFPKPMPLKKRLKDVLDQDVPEKFYLSEKMLELLTYQKKGSIEIANLNKGGQKGSIVSENSTHIGCLSASDYKLPKLVQIKTKQSFFIGALRGRNPENPSSRKKGDKYLQTLEINNNQISNILSTVQKDNIVIQLNPSKESNGKQPYKQNRVFDASAISPTLDTGCGKPNYKVETKIRKLTPRECLRLMGFPDSFKMPCSDTQMYKQAGNSIVVHKLAAIITNLLNL